jgi:hypothetical protein
MTQVVNIPGVGKLNFPDGMSQADMAAAIQRNFPQIHGAQQPQAPVDINSLPEGKPGPTSRVNFTPTQIQAMPAAQQDARGQRIFQNFAAQDSRNAVGGAEGAANLVSNIPATMAGGINMSASLLGGRGADESLRRFNATREGLTYRPRTQEGQQSADAMGQAAGLPAAAVHAGADKIMDWTNMPWLATAAETAGNAALMFGPAKTAGKVADAITARTAKPSPPSVPTTAQLKDASAALYQAADEAGVVIRPESTQRVVKMMQDVAEKENLGKLPPKLKEAADVLAERAASGKPLSLKDADKARQLINDAKKSTDAGDRRLASIIQRRYDDYLSNLKPEDTLAGNTTQGVSMLEQARGLYRRQKNSEMLDSMESKADDAGQTNYTQAGLEHALRREFAKLARNDKRMRVLKPEEQAAVKKVAAPGRAANTLRNIGKVDPTRGGMGAAMNTVVGGGTGAVLGGLMGGPAGAGAGAIAGQAGLAAAANVANRLALRGTKGRVAQARETLVGRGLPNVSAAKKGVFEPIAKAEEAPALAAAQPRSSTQIKLELQRLLVQMQSVRGGVDAAYAQGLKRQWDQLQGALRQQLSRESSGDATSRPPAK